MLGFRILISQLRHDVAQCGRRLALLIIALSDPAPSSYTTIPTFFSSVVVSYSGNPITPV